MNTKTKIIIVAAVAIAATIIITTITLWPTQEDDGEKEEGTDKQDDFSRFNMINLHYKITNHTIITTSAIVAIGVIIVIIFVIKEILHNKRIKKQKTTHKNQYEMRPMHTDPPRDHLAAPHTYQGRQVPRRDNDHTYLGWRAQAPVPSRQYDSEAPGPSRQFDSGAQVTAYYSNEAPQQYLAFDPFLICPPGPSRGHDNTDTYSPEPEPQSEKGNTRALTHSPPQDPEAENRSGRKWRK